MIKNEHTKSTLAKKLIIILLILTISAPSVAFARKRRSFYSYVQQVVAMVTGTGTTTPAVTATSTSTVVTAIPVVSQYVLGPDGLITNEYAHWNPNSTIALRSPIWDVTSGSLFIKNDKYGTGKIDSGKPNALSSDYTNSSIFRAHTKDFNYKNFSLAFNLYPGTLTSTVNTPAEIWDGVHVFLRYQSEFYLYYASVFRRDGYIMLKKKCPGGNSNGGTYYELSKAVQVLTPKTIKVTIADQADGSVKMQILDGTKVLVTGIDNGIGCPVITNAGAVGIRGDNYDFQFDQFSVVKN